MARLPHDTREGTSTLWCEHCATVVKRHNVSVFMQPFSASCLLHSMSTFRSAKKQRSSTVARNAHHFDGFAHTANTMLHWNRKAFDNKPFTPFTLLRLSHQRERMEHKLHATEKQTTHQRQRTGLTVIATSSTCTTSPVNSSGTSVNLSECSELCLVSWRDPAAAQAIVSPPTLSDCSLRLVIFTITVSHGRSNDLLNLALGDALLWDQLASATLIHHVMYGHVDFLHTAQRHQQIHLLIHCMSVT